jgi:voltage-gated potassium channel
LRDGFERIVERDRVAQILSEATESTRQKWELRPVISESLMLLKTPYPEYAELPGWRGKLNEVIFGTDSKAGRTFDLVLIIVIGLSVIAVMLESVKSIRVQHGTALYFAEWVFTILFTIDYVLRLVCAGRPLRYAFSFLGLVDLLATIPTYLSLLFPGAQALAVIRLLRILRVFRVLKLAAYMEAGGVIVNALRASRHKIGVFIFTVLTTVTILGSLMYFIEGEQNGFTSIPKSIYWAIVTLTTVGYGDISPQTDLGQALASAIMLLGYGMIAVPTGIVTAELSIQRAGKTSCLICGLDKHESDAVHCKKCGTLLVNRYPPRQPPAGAAAAGGSEASSNAPNPPVVQGSPPPARE